MFDERQRPVAADCRSHCRCTQGFSARWRREWCRSVTWERHGDHRRLRSVVRRHGDRIHLSEVLRIRASIVAALGREDEAADCQTRGPQAVPRRELPSSQQTLMQHARVHPRLVQAHIRLPPAERDVARQRAREELPADPSAEDLGHQHRLDLDAAVARTIDPPANRNTDAVRSIELGKLRVRLTLANATCFNSSLIPRASRFGGESCESGRTA